MNLRRAIDALSTCSQHLSSDLRLIVDRHRRAGRRFARVSTCTDMGSAVLTLLRTSIALRGAVGSSLGTRAALRWIFHVDVWTDAIGPGLSLPHPFNIVIGAGVTIGEGCTLMHNTTLQHARQTTIGDGAVIGAGAVVLADVQVGASSFCGANSVVTRDVPAATVVVGAPAREIRRSPEVRVHAS